MSEKKIIVANDLQGVIGYNGDIPWRGQIPADMAHFRAKTLGHTVLMGRTTYESIGKPLPKRRNIVLTSGDLADNGVEVARTMEEAFALSESDDEVWIMGGQRVYMETLPLVDEIHQTIVSSRFVGDTFFPEFDPNGWKLVRADSHESDAENRYAYTFRVLKKVGREPTVYLANAREQDQLNDMKSIEERGICFMCNEHIPEFYGEKDAIINEGEYCWLVRNGYPYPNTDHHIMAIPKQHTNNMSELSPACMSEMFQMFNTYVEANDIDGGAVAMRFGNPARTGATVHHLHMHLVVSKEELDPELGAVRFFMSRFIP